MRNNKTHSIFKIVFLGIMSLPALAGNMGDYKCEGATLDVPCPVKKRSVGAHALYMQSVYNNNFLLSANLPVTGAKQPWGWGFDINASYEYSAGRNIKATWYHLHTAQQTNFNAQDYGTVRPGWDAVNVEFGQLSAIQNQKYIRFHAGAQYSRIVNGIPINGSNIYGWNTGIYGTEYNGFGPRLGMDLGYKIYPKIYVYGKTAGSVLAGHASNSVQAPFNVGSASAVVPEVDAQLGLKYSLGTSYGKLSFDTGWMWVNYFNVAQVNPSQAGYYQQDFALQGLFFGMNFLGDL